MTAIRPAGCSVFLVEDEVMIRMMVADMLEELGHSVAAEAGEISPAFRREVEAQIKRSADLVAPLLEGNRAVWQTELGVSRYIGGR